MMETDETNYIRLLKPSISLNIIVWSGFNLVIFILVYFILFDYLLLAIFVMAIGSSGLTGIISSLITCIAEKRRLDPGLLFIADIEREKKHYGPLRANRLFGHPIGKSKWF